MGLFLLNGSASAASITLGGPVPDAREATLSSAVTGSGRTGSGNATVSHVEAYYGGDWTERAEVTKEPDNNSIFTIEFDDGGFDDDTKRGSGKWSINNPDFWSLYAETAISLHVGNAREEDAPDHFVWKITPVN